MHILKRDIFYQVLLEASGSVIDLMFTHLWPSLRLDKTATVNGNKTAVGVAGAGVS